MHLSVFYYIDTFSWHRYPSGN